MLAQASSPATDAALTVLALLFLGVLIWSLFWVYTDAERRGKSGCLVVLLVLLSSWPISLLLWIVSRPD
ncbi:MAG: hypothetical protein IGS50_14610 [Synechococcales cyanobacterium C42_A2020_086]|nr:hypothetical protein [Synechococcales cyanobacterium M58_A2018_015]MBF2074974.1 hypothetical protein [Synechococcales cyanobacterium C42_A2020_086]